MADPILKVDIDDKLYDPSTVIDKTLVAAKDLKVYQFPPDKTLPAVEAGIVKAGNPVGIVYGFLNPDPARNRSTLWWMFWPASGLSNVYYAPHNENDFDLSALRQQGVISVKEQIEEEKKKKENENKEWYEKLFDKAVPLIVTVVLGAAAIGVVGKIIAGRVSKKE